MRIAPSEKLACYTFTRCWLADGMPREIELRPRLWAVTSLDFDVAEHWQIQFRVNMTGARRRVKSARGYPR
jgi:hypothetical protein